MEFAGALDRILPGHGIRDEKDLDRDEQFAQLLQLRHQLVVDVKAAGSIHQQHIAPGLRGLSSRRTRQVRRCRFFGQPRVDR